MMGQEGCEQVNEWQVDEADIGQIPVEPEDLQTHRNSSPGCAGTDQTVKGDISSWDALPELVRNNE